MKRTRNAGRPWPWGRIESSSAMTPGFFLRVLSLLLVTFGFPTSVFATGEESRPNLLVILADDLGYADVQCRGSADMQTPSLNQLFRAGMTFTNAYANCPVCSPTRAALLSGRYQDLVGVPGVIRTHPENSWGYLDPGIELLPSIARRAGYRTAIVGKWHLGLESPNTPTERGFDVFRGFLGDMMDDYYHHRRHDLNYMRNGMQSVYEGGLKVPMCVVWPGHIAAETESPLATMSMDILPTLFQAATGDLPEGLDGRSFLPTLKGEHQAALRAQWIFTRREGGLRYGGKTIEAIRDGDWKLLQNSPFEPLELYNVSRDPQEANNVAKQNPAIVNRLNAALRSHLQRGGTVPWQLPE